MRCAACGKETGTVSVVVDGKVYCPDCIDRCAQCGKIAPVTNMETIGGKRYCRGCLLPCDYCAEWYPSEQMREARGIDGFLYCPNCVDRILSCAWCGSPVHEEDACQAVDGPICQTCAQRDAHYCLGCNRYTRHIVHDGSGNPYCPDCAEDFLTCDECGRRHHINHMECVDPEEDRWLCSRCADQSSIRDYIYVPFNLRFFGTPENERYFGLEIEMDLSDDDEWQEIVPMTKIMGYPMAWYKHDGSLDNGVECVTAPMSLDYIRGEFANKLNDLCAEALDLGYRSHNTETCGLHVHVSQASLADGGHAARITRLVNCDQSWGAIKIFSRRSKWNYCKRVDEDDYDYPEDRYVTVNHQNLLNDGSGTLEFRLFRGTLKWQTILAAVEFCDIACEVTRERDAVWSDMVNYAAIHSYPYFNQYLIERDLASVQLPLGIAA